MKKKPYKPYKPYNLGLKVTENAIGWAMVSPGARKGSDPVANIADPDKLINAVVDVAMSRISLMEITEGAPSEIALLSYKNEQDLLRYRPDMGALGLEGHRKLIALLSERINQMSLKSVIVEMVPEHYESWRGEKADNELLRTEWAALQPGF